MFAILKLPEFPVASFFLEAAFLAGFLAAFLASFLTFPTLNLPSVFRPL